MLAIQASGDRLAVSFLMALVLHAAILLGVGFAIDFKPLTHPLESLDVVLVNWRSETKPEEADFLARPHNRAVGRRPRPASLRRKTPGHHLDRPMAKTRWISRNRCPA